MTQIAREGNLDELLRHARWVQAFARHLIREDAEDLVQSVWLKATQHPPRATGSPRAWLAKVLQNRLRNQARDGHRRREREKATGALLDAPLTPLELTERMEMHRLLAELVAELPDEYRQVVHLRYVEDRAPTEIARLLQQPPGTIRWRLHEALARLRARLDQRPGGRRTWALALAPLAGLAPEIAEAAAAHQTSSVDTATAALAAEGRPGRRPWSSVATVVRPGGRSWLAGLAAALGLTALLVVGVVGYRRGVRDPDRAAGVGGSGGAAFTVGRLAGGGLGGPGVPRLATLPGAATSDTSCPAVEPMRQYVAALKAAADPWRYPSHVFAQSPPNPALETSLRPLMDGFAAKLPPGCDLSLSCRGQTCELSIMSPDGMRSWDCHPKPGPEFQERLASGSNNIVDSGAPYHDPIKGRSFTRMSQLWRFARPDGAPVPPDQRPPEPQLKFDLSRPAPTPPPDLAQACLEHWARLDREQQGIRRFLLEMAPDIAFPASAANPDLTEKVTTWTRKVLARQSTPLPFDVQCRGRVCKLAPSSNEDPLAIRWKCRESEPGIPPSACPHPAAATGTTACRRGWKGRWEASIPRRSAIRSPKR